MRKTGFVLAVAVAMLALPLFAGLASAGPGTGTITPTVEQGTTDRLGGGDWVVVHAGKTNFGVVYGTPSNPNKLYIFAEEQRYIAGVDFYDAGGNLIRTKGVPVWTVFAQSLDKMIEFKDTDGNSRFDMRMWESGMEGSDLPVKGLNLVQGWALSGLTQENSGKVLFVNFTVGISNEMYTWIWNGMTRRPVPATEADGEVGRVAFTFHIRVGVEDAAVKIPWFKVTISGSDEKRVLNKTFEGWREFSGQMVNMSAKYDHDIQGWDFRSDDSKLLLETKMMLGKGVPQELLERYRMREGGRAFEGETEHDGAEVGDESGTVSPEPRRMPTSEHTGTITFADDWFRVGRFTWASDVTVDGESKEMYFQVHGGGPMTFEFRRTEFVGFGVLAAFVYPAGDSIFHDPGFEAASYELSIPTITNLAPTGVLLLQVVLVVLAVVMAIVIRQARKGQKH